MKGSGGWLWLFIIVDVDLSFLCGKVEKMCCFLCKDFGWVSWVYGGGKV